MTNANVSTTTVTGGRATLCYGPWVEQADLAGQTIKQVRDAYSNLWTIPGDAVAMKGKEQLTEEYVIQPGDKIELFRRMGEKG